MDDIIYFLLILVSIVYVQPSLVVVAFIICTAGTHTHTHISIGGRHAIIIEQQRWGKCLYNIIWYVPIARAISQSPDIHRHQIQSPKKKMYSP